MLQSKSFLHLCHASRGAKTPIFYNQELSKRQKSLSLGVRKLGAEADLRVSEAGQPPIPPHTSPSNDISRNYASSISLVAHPVSFNAHLMATAMILPESKKFSCTVEKSWMKPWLSYILKLNDFFFFLFIRIDRGTGKSY